MIKTQKLLAIAAAVIWLAVMLILPSAAEGEKSSKISYGLDVIAAKTSVSVAGLEGNSIDFSAEKFERCMNLSEVKYITLTSLPSSAAGRLYVGSVPAANGQTLSADNIALLSYRSELEGESSDSFEFSVNGSGYSVTCNLYMLKEINYCPTLATVPTVSLNLLTYSDIKLDGRLSAYDPEGDLMTFEIVKYPICGTVRLTDASRGEFEYTPSHSYTGTDSFTYTVFDKYGNYSSSATVTLTVKDSANCVVFADMSDGAGYVSAVKMTDNGIMSGMQIGNSCYFFPEREVSRAEFLVMAMQAAGVSAENIKTTGFADDSDIQTSMKPYVATAYTKGYINGQTLDGDLLFLPNESITKAEAAVVLSNIIGYANGSAKPAWEDYQDIPTWAVNAMTSLSGLGIIPGGSEKVLPNQYLTRAETAEMLDKTIQVIGK